MMIRLMLPLCAFMVISAELTLAQPQCDYVEQAVIQEPTPQGNRFGFTMAYSNGTLVIGNPTAGTNGTAYVLDLDDTGSWTLTDELIPSVSGLSDTFGASVAIGTDRIVVGANNADGSDISSGVIVIFDRQADGRWLEAARAVASDTASSDRFGKAVAISEDDQTIVVGAPGNDMGSLPNNEGAIYIFDYDATTDQWSESRFFASNASNGLELGQLVAIDGDIVAASSFSTWGAPHRGAVYVFERQQDQWQETNIILPSGQRSYFSITLALSGNTLIAGNTTNDVYAFEKQDSNWVESQRIQFGSATSIRATALLDNRLMISTLDTSGAHSIYNRPSTGGTWTKSFELAQSDVGLLPATFKISGLIAEDHIFIGNYSDSAQAVYDFPNPQGTVTVCPSTPSASLGATITVSVNAGSAYSGMTYWVLGSVSGSVPGFDYGGLTIPLNNDDYFYRTFDAVATPISNSIGTLDANGQATAQLVVSPDATLSGGIAHHSYIVLDPLTLDVLDVGEAIPLRFVP